MRPWKKGDHVAVCLGNKTLYYGTFAGTVDAFIEIHLQNGTVRYAVEAQLRPSGKTAWTLRHMKFQVIYVMSKALARKMARRYH